MVPMTNQPHFGIFNSDPPFDIEKSSVNEAGQAGLLRLIDLALEPVPASVPVPVPVPASAD